MFDRALVRIEKNRSSVAARDRLPESSALFQLKSGVSILLAITRSRSNRKLEAYATLGSILRSSWNKALVCES